MKLELLIAIAFAIVSLSQAGVYTEKYFRDDKHPGKCFIQGKIVSPGQSIKHPTMDCAEFTCDNSIGLATIETLVFYFICYIKCHKVLCF